jgi:hypothetical protein
VGAGGSQTGSGSGGHVGGAGTGGAGAFGGFGPGGAGHGGGPEVVCKDQYDPLAQAIWCTESSTTCVFVVDTADSCSTYCLAHGGRCLSAARSDSGGCNALIQANCTTTGVFPKRCTCTRGCGNDPPCVPPDECTAGGCISPL